MLLGAATLGVQTLAVSDEEAPEDDPFTVTVTKARYDLTYLVELYPYKADS